MHLTTFALISGSQNNFLITYWLFLYGFTGKKMKRPVDANATGRDHLYGLLLYSKLEHSNLMNLKWLSKLWSAWQLYIDDTNQEADILVYALGSVSLVTSQSERSTALWWWQNYDSEFTKLTIHEFAWHHQNHASLGPKVGHKLPPSTAFPPCLTSQTARAPNVVSTFLHFLNLIE